MTLADATGLSAIDARSRARLLSVERYTVELDLTEFAERSTFRSCSTVRFTCVEPGSTSWIDLDAREVTRVCLNDVDLDVTQVVHNERVLLPQLASDNTLTVEARHDAGRGRGLSRSVDAGDGLIYAWTQFEPYDARRAFACFDQPDLKASFLIAARVPREWTCVSNGDVAGIIEEDATRLWSFTETPVLPTYVTALCAGPFHTVTDSTGLPVRLHARRSLATVLDRDAAELITLTRAGLDHFGHYFGVAYAGDSYDYVFLADHPGAMENYGCVTWNDHTLYRSAPTGAERARRRFVLLHEMAHMWFGNLVTLQWWDGLWLNESFADWAGFWAAAAFDADDRSWTQFLLTHKVRGYAADQMPTTHPISLPIPDVEAAEASFDMITYAKGAAVLRQLVAWVGEPAFLAGLRSYFARYEWRNADLDALLAELSAASGRDLREWTDQWLRHPGVNTLRVDAPTSGERYRHVTVRQDGEPHRMHRIRMGCYDIGPSGAAMPREAIELDVTGAATSVPALHDAPAGVLFPNDGDLTFAKTRFDDQSLHALIESGHTLPTTLMRAAAVIALRDMVLDRELRATILVGMVSRCMRNECDSGVVSQLLAIAVEAATVYTGPGNRAAAATLIADATLQPDTEAGDNERRRALNFGLAETATSPQQVAALTAMLADAASDQALRWACVTRLAALGRVTDSMIYDEARRDPDPDAALRAQVAQAARPTADAKDAAFAGILDEALSATARQQLAEAFWQADQEELLRPYVARYLDALPALAHDPHSTLQGSLVKRTFPMFGVDDAFVRAVNTLAETISAPLLVRNELRDKAHQLAAALHARAFDERG